MNEAELHLVRRRRRRTDPLVLLARRAARRLLDAATLWSDCSETATGFTPEEAAFAEKARKQEKGCRADAKSLIALAAELERRQTRRRETEDDDGQ